MEIMCLGIVTVDILVRQVPNDIFTRDTTIVKNISQSVGGDALNVAVNLSKMGFSTGICGMTGDDQYGMFIRNFLGNAKVDISGLCEKQNIASSVSVVMISSDGQRHFLFCQGATAELSYEDVSLELLDNVRVLSIGSWFALPGFHVKDMKRLLSYARERGVITVMDVTNNPKPNDMDELDILLPFLDYFIPSYEEASALSGLKDPAQITKFFREKGAGTVIVKLGGKGACGDSGNGAEFVPATHDVPVDTTGAGDCFTAGIIAAVLHGCPLRQALIFACKAAGLSITKAGATSAAASYEEIDSRWKNMV